MDAEFILTLNSEKLMVTSDDHDHASFVSTTDVVDPFTSHIRSTHGGNGVDVSD